MGILGLPSATVIMGAGSSQLEMGWFGPTVAALRRSIQSEPGTQVAARDALQTLKDNAGNFLGGGVRQHLAQLRQDGKDHLCIHPHGPLHFHPQHLVGDSTWILADDWIVTYVPHPALLREPAQAARVDVRHDLVSIGIDFRNSEPHGLPPLPSAVVEASGVAAAFDGQCLSNQEATKAALLDALLGSRRLHIATHGSQDGSAPAFQRLYLWPHQGSGGIVYVYEIVGFDLSHLDLVTLSACETSLGRFDISDTLRGLCASLFTAGVATIISTQWAVEDSVARFFFEGFYKSLKQGSGKLDAFRTAQVDTRKKYPAYRDWGAFQYSGRWR
jgi:CHAT domain-containing protein